MDDIDKAFEDWKRRVDEKTKSVISQFDKGVIKGALFAEQKAKENAMNEIYNNPVPTTKSGRPKWKRTGLYKASIGSGINPDKEHSGILFNNLPYAKPIEFGTSRGIKGKYILTNAITKNVADIKNIIKQHIREVTK